MNLEQLQLLSDAELNELSAVKVMGWRWHNNFQMWMGESKSYEKWDPTTDMNDAMILMDKMKVEHDHIGLYYSHCMGTTWTVTITDIGASVDDDFPDVKEISIEANTAPRAITIASILTKEG